MFNNSVPQRFCGNLLNFILFLKRRFLIDIFIEKTNKNLVSNLDHEAISSNDEYRIDMKNTFL